uniref:Maintenance of Photosystem II under High light 2 C-terminal domain-containing protein n=1 Tax=Pyramimonas obovata TaxID=1411642 RepID=A0A7S0R9Q6_9CHLO|eukprot:CAMPEP_0118946956 /NCGR_PEP_ID=MMETSP1169-20130426/45152_1 /TAXON_ID=36882 /ORGANISM="Pyramimonas obovata, Strain CCMP722" /LENGTH=221 /DNA_ID=CAMNT_0006893071 /DNA_START=56 /DNA_END=721 /DNA_ORIENTATION=+
MSFTTINSTAVVPKTTNVAFGSRRAVARAMPASKAVRCEVQEDKVQMSRRGLVSLVAAAPAMQAAKALALIDYDEDDELLSKVREQRKAKVQKELIAERAFVKEGGFKDKVFDNEIVYVQKAINRLSKAGSLIKANETGDLKDVVLGDAWVRDLKGATSAISKSAEAQESAKNLFASINALQNNVKSKAKPVEIKASYLGVVGALESWCTETDLVGSVNGL